ncbi:hypothetical protein ACS0TY_025148 [Phlomoides rotata]
MPATNHHSRRRARSPLPLSSPYFISSRRATSLQAATPPTRRRTATQPPATTPLTYSSAAQRPVTSHPYRVAKPPASPRPSRTALPPPSQRRRRRLGTSQQLKSYLKEQFQLIYKVVQISI